MERIISQDFKETEIGPIPKDWEVVRLGDIIEFSKKSNSKKIRLDETIPFIPMELISEKSSIANHQMKSLAEISSGTFVQKNDLIIAKITPSFENGKQAILSDLPTPYGYATTEIWAFHPKNRESIIEYLFNYLKISKLRKDLASKMEGSTGRQRLPRHVLEELLIPLPPLPEQRAIANVLSTVQENIEKTEIVINSTRELKKSLMNHLFTYGPVPINEAENVKIKETEVGLIPEDWKVVKLRNVANLKNGINFKREEKGRSGILTIDVLNMYGENIYVNTKNLYRINKRVDEEYYLRKGDLLFVRSSLKREGIGWASLVNDFSEKITFCGFIIRARLISSSILPEYLVKYLRTDIARKNLISSSGKVAITNINQGMLGNISFPLPPLPIQKQIADILSEIDRKIEAEENKAKSLEKLFQSLLNDLMTGKIRVREEVA